MLEKLYNAYYLQVYSFLLSLSGNPSLAEELTQETFFKVMTSKAEFRGQAKEQTWLCSIAKNLYLDEMRKRRRFADAEEEMAVSGFETEVADKDLSLQLHRVLHTLPEPHREVFQLRIFGELSFSEIGSVFGKTESWARVTYHRARMKLRERMEKNQ